MPPFGPTVHVLRIQLRHIEPPIWRTFAVASDTKLPKFNRILHAVMGWEGYHLHMFNVAEISFGEKDEDADYVIPERNITVQQILPRPGSALRWDYDFGDGWEHDVVVESIDEPRPEARYPICTGGERACPPEDCGGVPGFADLLEAIGDPAHPEHDELVAWTPDGFDPAVFDMVAANRRLPNPTRSRRG